MAAKGSKGCLKLEEYKKQFKKIDKNNDGFLDAGEFKAMLRGEQCQCHLTDAEIEESFEMFEGPNGDKRITFEEFCNGLDGIMALIEELYGLFKALDTDNSGSLEKNELKALLQKSKKGQKLSDADIDKLMKDADVSGDGKIDFEEFIVWLC